MTAPRIQPNGYSLLGILITMALIVVLFAISMTAFDKAITGAGNTESGTVASFEDKLNLTQIYQSLLFSAQERGGEMPRPSKIVGNLDSSLDTTANLYSSMIAQNLVKPASLISGNERNPYVWADENYDYTTYAPALNSFWDASFKADLREDSNVSFAHQPMFGKRLEHWRKPSFSATVPMFGNRGPKDGLDDPSSYTYSKDGSWAGHAVFGDGHVEFWESFTPGSVMFHRNGVPSPDNVFAFDDGPAGGDAILTFTKMIRRNDIEIQHD